MSEAASASRRRGLGVWLGRGALLAFSLLLVASFAELALRVAPWLLPKGHYGVGHFDEDLKLNVHGGPAIYNKVRFVRRVPNDRGFMDVEHAAQKPQDVLRVGFFGDSYVESIQVPLEQTFFHLLEARLASSRVETLSLGISGWGTLHSWMAYEALADEFDLDVVVYAFVANDPGDNSARVQGGGGGRRTPKPSAVPAPGEPGFELRWPVDPANLSLTYRVGKWIQGHSLLAQLIHSRRQLIAKQGLAGAASQAGAKRRLNQNDPPSQWPEPVLREAKQVTGRILEHFAARVRADGRRFLVLYVPRGEDEVAGTLAERDRWLPWLRSQTARLGIPLLDPIEALRERQRAGTPVYDDHWSPAGHDVIAGFLARALCSEGLACSDGEAGNAAD